MENEINLENLIGRQCIGAIDYASTQDFNLVGLLFRDKVIENKEDTECNCCNECEDCTCKDEIKQPNHYKLDGLGVESIDVIKAVLGKDGFKSFCIGNCLKYLIRAEKKNGLEDYKKCKTYLDWILEG